MKKALQPEDYLKKILTARVYDVAVESALEPAGNLSRRLHNTVLLKREDQQPVFSFKLRGAYNKMAHLTPAQLKKGVIGQDPACFVAGRVIARPDVVGFPAPHSHALGARAGVGVDSLSLSPLDRLFHRLRMQVR